MKRRKRKKYHYLIWAVAIAATVIIISIAVLLALTNDNPIYGFARDIPESEQQLRMQFVAAAESWLGSNEQDGSHKHIIDLYNQHEPLAQNYLVKYDDEWCATFVSASAIQAGLTQIIPTECGCQRQIELFRNVGSWEEADDYIPLPGDIIYYCRSNKDPINDCTGWSDHVGIVIGTNGNRIKVIEGNYGDQVGYRYLPVDALMIRGYAIPDYAQMY